MTRLDVNWGEFQVQVKYDDIRLFVTNYKLREEDFAKNERTIRRLIRPYKIKFIYVENGLTDRGYDLCKRVTPVRDTLAQPYQTLMDISEPRRDQLSCL